MLRDLINNDLNIKLQIIKQILYISYWFESVKIKSNFNGLLVYNINCCSKILFIIDFIIVDITIYLLNSQNHNYDMFIICLTICNFILMILHAPLYR